MKTAGQILSSARIEQNLELSDVSRVTKIRATFLQGIEADDYSKMSSGATTRGFIRNYSEFLNLNPDHVLAVFRRDFIENPLGQIVPRGVAEPVIRKSLWTPKATIFSFVVVVFVIFGGYLLYQYRILTGPPTLEVVNPNSDLSTQAEYIDIIGSTDPEATISINNELVALEKAGNFSLRYPLESGINVITIEAKTKSGNSSKVIRQITKN